MNEAQKVWVSSYASSMCAIMVGYPLDTIKTRVQTFNYPSWWGCVRSTFEAGGVASFYRGIAASMFSAGIARAFTMSVYNILRPNIAQATGLAPGHLINTFSSGFVAGGLCTIFTAPFEFTKVASQVESLVYQSRGLNEPKKIGTIQAVRDLSRRGGWRSLYGGYRYHFGRDAIGSGIYFSVYEQAKASMSRAFPARSDGSPNPISVAVAGGLCGVLSWVFVYPLDTMKSSYQRDLYNHSLASSLEFRETVVERPRLRLSLSMYRGLGLSVVRTSINGMVLFSCYEYFMYHL